LIKNIDKKIWIYIGLAFIFSIAIRLIWVYQFWDVEAFKWNNQFMINTNDGYFWAEGARDILRGKFEEFSLSPVFSAPAWLTAFFVKVLPFSFESIIFYMPAFLSSLVVIPMILIAKSLGRVEVGFASALIGSIAWSYYNRTMVGYFDTDMLNILFPTLLLWSLILSFNTQEDKYLLFTALEIIAYRLWYPQSYSLEFAFFGLILLYTLIYERKNLYMYKLLSIMLFAMMGLPSLVRFIVVVGLYMLYRKKKLDGYIHYVLGFAFALFFLSGGFTPIWSQLKGYVFKDSIKSVSEGLGLHFFTVMQTIREAGKIPFETFANRISGHTIAFLLSIVGYVLMAFRYRVMLLALPMLALGFLAYVGGLRFTIYAVPVAAFGMGYLIFFAADFFKHKILKSIFITACMILVLYPNVLHVVSYKVPTVFTKQEVIVLDKLKKRASRDDYAIAWWDYGYPIRYYADVKTLIDGGKHSGEVNFPVSFMLTNPQNISAKLARLDVEYTQKMYRYKKEHKKEIEDKNLTIFSNIEYMTKDYGFKDTNDFLISLQTNLKLPPKTRDVYFYLPFRMMGILPTVARFSDIDLMSGKTNRRLFFYQTNRFKDSGSILNLDNGIIFNKQTGMIKIGDKEVPLKEFFVTYYNQNKKLIRQKQTIREDGLVNLIFMKSYNTVLVVDNAMLNSLYIQLFVFENYDKNLFEPIVLEPSAKVFRLKL
jgi:dolichyl-diphosphooligosaccharide--protein glycosyltransferase/undecaprenyl-diphosphooligosaccharide--protein glycosyltransferase